MTRYVRIKHRITYLVNLRNMKQFIVIISFSLIAIFFTAACNKEKKTVPVIPVVNSNLKIVSHNDEGFASFNRKVVVFGIDIYAVAGVTDKKLLHAANVMAQYLDNDEDGVIDNQLIVDKMLENKAFVVMWKNENDLNMEMPDGRMGQDLGNDETNPDFVKNGNTGSFDASIEEIWHIITNAGYAQVYPKVFGISAGTELCNALDIARGGNFVTIPNSYPANAWFTYDDATCEYDCQATEYFYWALSSVLGAQQNRLSEIGNEWKLNTKALVESTDVAIYNLLTDPKYKIPTVLPDGSYR